VFNQTVVQVIKATKKATKKRKPKLCISCFTYYADFHNKNCVGCAAYKEHTGEI